MYSRDFSRRAFFEERAIAKTNQTTIDLELNASNFSLIFDTSFDILASGWSTVYLNYNQKHIELGAEALDIILKKMYGFLNRETFPQAPSKLLNADGYVLFLVLMVKWSYAEAKLCKSGLELVFRDSDCKLICNTQLSWQECAIWREKINNYWQ